MFICSFRNISEFSTSTLKAHKALELHDGARYRHLVRVAGIGSRPWDFEPRRVDAKI